MRFSVAGFSLERASLLALVLLLGCGRSMPPPETPRPGAPRDAGMGSPSAVAATTTTDAKLSPPLDERAVAAATGAEKPESSGGVVKVSFPRKDVRVAVDGFEMAPFMGLTSWAAFSPGRAGVAEAMVMGDLVLFEDEVSPVMSALLASGVAVTALHNHFFFDQPHVYFMHIGGEGTVASLGKGVRLALEKTAEIRKAMPKPATTFGAPPPARNAIDAAKLEATFGLKGQAKDGMFKLVVGRETSASCGCTIGKAMGVNTWAAFAGTDDDAIVDGDFAVNEGELQVVLGELRGAGIHVVAIHHHMSGETPRMLFLHYWGRGKAVDLAASVKRALERTAYDGKKTST